MSCEEPDASGNEGEQMEVIEQKSDMVRCVDPNIPSG